MQGISGKKKKNIFCLTFFVFFKVAIVWGTDRHHQSMAKEMGIESGNVPRRQVHETHHLG